MSVPISFAFSTLLSTLIFTRDIVLTCVVDTSNESCENGEHIQDVDPVFPLTVAVKISRWHYF